MYFLDLGQPPGGDVAFQTIPTPPLPSTASPAPMPKRVPAPPPIRRQVCSWAGMVGVYQFVNGDYAGIADPLALTKNCWDGSYVVQRPGFPSGVRG